MTFSPRKILVVALDNLGDAVMASAVLDPLKKKFPDSIIGLWVKEYTAGLFEGHPQIDHLYAADPFWDVSPGLPAGGVRAFLSMLSQIRAKHYDTALLLNTEWRRTLAVWAAGIPHRIGFDRRHSGAMLSVALPVPALIQHFMDDHRALVTAMTPEPLAEPFLSRLAVSANEHRAADLWREKSGINRKNYWVAHLFSGDAFKNWPVARWLELMAIAAERWPDQRCVVLLGPSEAQKLSASEIDELNRRTAVLQSPSLRLLKAMLEGARVVVDGDSGPGHVAAAVGTPVVSLFGKTNPLRSRPIGPSPVRIVSAGAVADIAVREVWDAMAQSGPRV